MRLYSNFSISAGEGGYLIHNFIDKVWKVSEHKYVEIQLTKPHWKSIVRFEFDIVPKTWDHAGFGFEMSVLGCGIIFRFYDHRHADMRGFRRDDFEEVTAPID